MRDNVTLIPARRKAGSRVKTKEEKPKLRIAAYCRVSTDSDEQAGRLPTIRTIFPETLNGNWLEYMRMMESPAPTPKNVSSSTR